MNQDWRSTPIFASAPRAPRLAGMAVAAGLHAAVIGILLSHAPTRTALSEAVPLMVSIITPAAPEVTPAPPAPPQPLLQPAQAASPPPRAAIAQPVFSAQADTPAADSVPPAPVALPAPPVVTDPTPAAVAATPTAPAATSPAPPTPVAVVPPNFHAAYLNNPPPAYPRLARRQGHHGKVVLRVFVGASGSAETVQVRSSCGHEELDQAAAEAVRRWRFVPARQGDQAIAAWVLVPITFTLEN